MLKDSRIDMKDVYLYILSRDGDSAAKWLGFKFSDGNFTPSVKKTKEFLLNRGLVATGSVRDADETPLEISFEGEFATYFGDEDALVPYTVDDGDIQVSAYEMLMYEGLVMSEGWKGLGSKECEPYCTALLFVNDPTARRSECGEGEGVLYRDFFCEQADVDVSAGTMSFSGKCKRVAPEKVAWATVTAGDSFEYVIAGTSPVTVTYNLPSTAERTAALAG